VRPYRAAALACAAALGAGCAGNSSPQAGASATAAASAPTATNTDLERTPIKFEAPRTGDKYIYLTKQRQNRKLYVLRADAEKGRYFGEDSGQSTFVNPHVTFFQSDGKQLVADAPAGLVVEKAKTVQMSGGVHARSQDGVTLTSDSLRYDDATETVRAIGNVVMDSPQGSELRGSTLDWNMTTGEINVTGAR
jgi:LPS export ABC transporter protein LptC